MPYKKKNWRTHLMVDGVDYGYFASAEGGGIDSDDGSYDDDDGTVRLGGKRTRDDITLKRLYRQRDHAAFKALEAAAGSGRAVVTKTPTDDDGQLWGDPIVRTGILKSVKEPDQDKGSSDGGELEVVVTPDVEAA